VLPPVAGLAGTAVGARVMAAMTGVTVLCTLVVGLVPAAVLAWRATTASALRDGGTAVSGLARSRLRRAIVVGQVAIAVVLVLGAGLLVRALASQRATPLGFEPAHTLTFSVPLPWGVDPADITGLTRRVLDRLEQAPGVRAAGRLAHGQPRLLRGDRPAAASRRALPGGVDIGVAARGGRSGAAPAGPPHVGRRPGAGGDHRGRPDDGRAPGRRVPRAGEADGDRRRLRRRALLLTAIGLYGLLAGEVAARVPEIGIRLALGAAPRQVLAQTLRRGATLTLAGVALGLLAAPAAVGSIGGMLAGRSARDGMAIAAAAGVLFVVALGASLMPAWRAARIDPNRALRAE
jgi:hypothetical protein